MVLAFLRAEIHSPRFRAVVIGALGGDRSLVYSPRLDDSTQNTRRRRALAAVRGFGVGTYLFRGFPSDVEWRRVALTREEVGGLQYANHPTWVTLSDGSRLVREGAANVERIDTGDGTNANILEVERSFAAVGRSPKSSWQRRLPKARISLWKDTRVRPPTPARSPTTRRSRLSSGIRPGEIKAASRLAASPSPKRNH